VRIVFLVPVQYRKFVFLGRTFVPIAIFLTILSMKQFMYADVIPHIYGYSKDEKKTP
jgi:hypothetical protein